MFHSSDNYNTSRLYPRFHLWPISISLFHLYFCHASVNIHLARENRQWLFPDSRVKQSQLTSMYSSLFVCLYVLKWHSFFFQSMFCLRKATLTLVNEWKCKCYATWFLPLWFLFCHWHTFSFHDWFLSNFLILFNFIWAQKFLETSQLKCYEETRRLSLTLKEYWMKYLIVACAFLSADRVICQKYDIIINKTSHKRVGFEGITWQIWEFQVERQVTRESWKRWSSLSQIFNFFSPLSVMSN